MEYSKGVAEFIAFASKFGHIGDKILSPCNKFWESHRQRPSSNEDTPMDNGGFIDKVHRILGNFDEMYRGSKNQVRLERGPMK